MATVVRRKPAATTPTPVRPVRFVFILGFERYGRDLFAQVEAQLKRRYPAVSIGLYSEQDLLPCEPCGRAGEGLAQLGRDTPDTSACNLTACRRP